MTIKALHAFLKTGVAIILVVALATLLAPACGALPDAAKSKRMIAEEIYGCLDSDTREAAAFLGGKDRWLQFFEDANTKEELIEIRALECAGR